MKLLSLFSLLSSTFLMSTTVTSGQLSPTRSGGVFTLAGDNFNVTDRLELGSWGEIFGPSRIGTSVTVDGRISGWDITYGSGIVNGVNYSSIFGGGSYFSFTGPNVIMNPGLVIGALHSRVGCVVTLEVVLGHARSICLIWLDQARYLSTM